MHSPDGRGCADGPRSTRTCYRPAAMTEADTLLREALERLVRGEHLDVETARSVMDRVMRGSATPAQIGAILAALRIRG
ncbi:MAG TPA: hypothetical protein VGE42_14175, partial [Candidatus Dormibacteraeota bacterium]